MALLYNGIYSCDTSEVGTEDGKKYAGIFSIDTDADAKVNDGVCSVDGAKHEIVVNDGTGSGNFIEGEVVKVAPTTTEGFLGWTIEGAGYIDTDGNLVVGDGDAELTPQYEEEDEDEEE